MKMFARLIVLLLSASSLSGALVATTTTITSSINPSTYGQNVTFTATVTSSQGVPPDGEKITFLQGTTTLGTALLTSGSATFGTSILTTGTDKIKAAYAGDSNFKASTSQPVAQVVQLDPTTTTLISSPNPANFGQLVVLTATVTGQVGGNPITGSVAFYNGTTKLGTGVLSGVWRLTAAPNCRWAPIR